MATPSKKNQKDKKPKDHITFRPRKINLWMIEKLEELAKEENRNPNNYVETVLLDHIRQKEQTG